MYIIFVKNYKRKIVIAAIMLALWASMFFISGFIINNNLVCTVTIDNYLSFSHPYHLEVDNVFVNELLCDNDIVASSSFKKPLTQNFSSYTSLKGKFSFNYPTSFNLNQQDFAGSDILYHINFNSKTKNSYGFVQVWNLPQDLKNFLEQSKLSSQLNYKSFSTRPVTVNGLPGYLWDYTVVNQEGKSHKGLEAFLKKGEMMYRISYFMPENLWNQNESDVFWSMVNSFKTY